MTPQFRYPWRMRTRGARRLLPAKARNRQPMVWTQPKPGRSRALPITWARDLDEGKARAWKLECDKHACKAERRYFPCSKFTNIPVPEACTTSRDSPENGRAEENPQEATGSALQLRREHRGFFLHNEAEVIGQRTRIKGIESGFVADNDMEGCEEACSVHRQFNGAARFKLT